MYSGGYGHGDALRVGDFVPERPGLEIFSCFEHTGGAALRDAKTGEAIFRAGEGEWDCGRCTAGNFIASHPGFEFAYIGSPLLDSAGKPVLNEKGEEIGWPFKWTMNSTIYWDGELEQQNLDRNIIECYQHGRELTAPGGFINGTKANACLTADLFGDWREEAVFTADNDKLRIFSSTIPTKYRIPTLMHDTQYRCQVAEENVGYNQPPNLSYYLGTGSPLPKQPNVKAVTIGEQEEEQKQEEEKKQEEQKQEEQKKNGSGGQETPKTTKDPVFKKGETYTVGAYRYKITNPDTGGAGTVELTGAKNKKIKKVKIQNTVCIKGKIFAVTSIGNKAFRGYKKLSAVDIGKNVTSIGKSAFENCKKLKKMTIRGKKLKKIGKNAFREIARSFTVKVPSAKKKTYKKLIRKKNKSCNPKMTVLK